MHSLSRPRDKLLPPSNKPEPHVAILLCTYNGEKFLEAQLNSILLQTHKNWTLYISDDGSTDATLEIVEAYRHKLLPNNLILMSGPKAGFSKNFLSLVKNPNIEASFYAFCDQDDVWFIDKLERGINHATAQGLHAPFLYCSRTRLVDVAGIPTGLSPLFAKTPTFRNALVQSLAGANTMLINTATKELLSKVPDDAPIPAHDWLAYLLVSATGGTIIYDASPTLDYRQHAHNLIGANTGVSARLSGLVKMFSGRFKVWNSQNIFLLAQMRTQFTVENIETFDNFVDGRRCGFFQRMKLIKKSGVYRQTLAGNITLWFAATFKKL